MATVKKISTTAMEQVIANPWTSSYYNVVALAAPSSGEVTGGTLTVECLAPKAAQYESPTVNTIDMAAPARIEIQGKIESYRFTVTGFAGTATEVSIALDSYGSGQN